MSLLYLHFEGPERDSRLQKLTRSGARVVVTEPRWPGFHEVAKKEKPYAIAIDFSLAPSHSLETADYLAKAKETKETPLYVLRVPDDRVDVVRKRLPHAFFVTEPELSEKLAELEREAEEKARQKKQAAAEARKLARARNAKAAAPTAGKPAAAAAPAKAAVKKKPAPAPKAAPKKKPAPAAARSKKTPAKKHPARPPKKK
jgi:hypothetical protein